MGTLPNQRWFRSASRVSCARRPSTRRKVIFPAGHRVGFLNPTLYDLACKHGKGGIVDITSGTSTYVFCSSNCGTASEVDTTVPGFSAVPGYDMSSGLGTIDGAKFVAALARSRSDGHGGSDQGAAVQP